MYLKDWRSSVNHSEQSYFKLNFANILWEGLVFAVVNLCACVCVCARACVLQSISQMCLSDSLVLNNFWFNFTSFAALSLHLLAHKRTQTEHHLSDLISI